MFKLAFRCLKIIIFLRWNVQFMKYQYVMLLGLCIDMERWRCRANSPTARSRPAGTRLRVGLRPRRLNEI